jgi:hypothetical protein
MATGDCPKLAYVGSIPAPPSRERHEIAGARYRYSFYKAIAAMTGGSRDSIDACNVLALLSCCLLS